MENIRINKVQEAAFELIQSDARFLNTIIDINTNAKNIDSNFLMMCQPYIGIFADGAEQWCRKMGLAAPVFNKKEKTYYSSLRQGHKLFEKSYNDYTKALMYRFYKSDNYFFRISGLRKNAYYNVGTDICNGEFCGNTILCALHTPIDDFEDKNSGDFISEMGVIVGKLAAFLGCRNFPPYNYDDINNIVIYKDYHFYHNCPLVLKNDVGFVLFSILCNINYAIKFVENYFVENIPQKFKFAYLQYYYLCDFIREMNELLNTKLELNSSLKNRNIRNCLAHYGLGQFMKETDIDKEDILKGITVKAFNMEYYHCKELLYDYLNKLAIQIKYKIF